MKKYLLTILILNSLYAFAVYHDGMYYVEAKKSKYGWTPFTEITIVNNKVAKVIHNRKNKKGELASQDDSLNKKMFEKSGSSPKEYSEKIPVNFATANYSIKNMDGIAGATGSVNEFKQMAKYLLIKAEKGKPGEYKIRLKK